MWRFVKQESGTQKSEIARFLKLPAEMTVFLAQI